MHPNQPHGEPWKTGFCDAVMAREANSPWKDMGYKALHKNLRYMQGYAAGKESAVRHNLKG